MNMKDMRAMSEMGSETNGCERRPYMQEIKNIIGSQNRVIFTNKQIQP